MKDIIWTVVGTKPSEKGVLTYTPAESYSTKREAVAAMLGRRKPKTAILRVGHGYIYALAE
jgi:hypothetical protein